jgi:hypothetical protein
MSLTVSPSIRCPLLEPPPGVQGILRVAVLDAVGGSGPPRLAVTFAQPVGALQQQDVANPRNYTLTGGQRLSPRVISATLNPTGTPAGLLNQFVELALDIEGDFSIYTLSLSAAGIDPFFSSRTVRFRLGCDDPFDCRTPPSPGESEPELNVVIDYLSKDFSSFRQALLDFIPTRFPGWTERNVADLGMMLLDLFAYAADHLSDLQDRVANEAFLSTAKQRRSVAGHLALVGYALDSAAAACTWLQFQVNSFHALSIGSRFRAANRLLDGSEPTIVFETINAANLRPEHNQMTIYGWGNSNCCLPVGALSAELVGSYPFLQIGDFLLFDNQQGGREVVQLTSFPQIATVSSSGSLPQSQTITVVRWSQATPLGQDYCVAQTIVRGNLVAASHGETVAGEPLRPMPQTLSPTSPPTPTASSLPPPRLRLRLAQGPLVYLDSRTVATVVGSSTAPPAASPAPSPSRLSTLQVQVDGFTGNWSEVPSLLDSGPDDQVFRVELDDAGNATLVFGDGNFGLRPPDSAQIRATYRVGGWTVGNVGADVLTRPLPHDQEDVSWLGSSSEPDYVVTNPLPAFGGRDMESSAHARQFGPGSVQQPLSAVTIDDYQAAALAYTDSLGQQPIRRASASFEWTGSWLTVTLAVDRHDSQPLDSEQQQALIAYLNGWRLAGYDLQLIQPNYVPIELAIDICLSPGAAGSDVEQAILQALGATDLPGGSKGFFHPDNFPFGMPVYVSRLYAALLAVPGVNSATITRLARLRVLDPNGQTTLNLSQGYLTIGADQIARLDNDRNFPENGTLTLAIGTSP